MVEQSAYPFCAKLLAIRSVIPDGKAVHYGLGVDAPVTGRPLSVRDRWPRQTKDQLDPISTTRFPWRTASVCT